MDVAVDCGYIIILMMVDFFILFSDVMQLGKLMNYS